MILAEKFVEVTKARAILGSPLSSARDLHTRDFHVRRRKRKHDGMPIATTEATETHEPLQQPALNRICYPDAIRIILFFHRIHPFSFDFFLLAVSCIFIDRWYHYIFFISLSFN